MSVPAGRLTAVTEFFRTPSVWAAIREHVTGLPAEPVIWSGACATGEEVYSAAFLAAEERWATSLVGTDLDADNVAAARSGRYTADCVAGDVAAGRLNPEQVATFFDVEQNERALTVVDAIRERVRFKVAELGVDRPPACHVALVRNVWRHLTPDRQRTLAEHIHDALLSGGILVLGGADFYSEDEWQRTGRLVARPPAGLQDLFVESDVHELIWVPR